MVAMKGLLAAILAGCFHGIHSTNTITKNDGLHRELSFPLFFSYEPRSQVSDHAAMDMDQREIVYELAKLSSEGFQNARNVYMKGAHSRPYAIIRLNKSFGREIPVGTVLFGYNSENEEVIGSVLDDVKENDNEIQFLYLTSDVLGEHVDCQVGGSSEPFLDGCLAPSGIIMIGPNRTPMNYTYDPLTDNANGRRFSKFSLSAQKNLFDCYNCPYDDYLKFYNYYGSYDYADDWIQSAFSGLETRFKNGPADFSRLSRIGRAGAIHTGTAFLNLWMYVIRQMEEALDSCNVICDTTICNDDKVHPWDVAVAFYTGSLEQFGEGFLTYSLADEMCYFTGTCDYGDGSTARVNTKIFEQFNEGQQNIIRRECSSARENKERIVQLMTVPLVQASILYAHHISLLGKEREEEALGHGAGFAFSVLPFVHHCSPSDAEIIYNGMTIAHDAKRDYEGVKSAFERNYACMGITCEDVGGIIDDETGDFYDDGLPCRNREVNKIGRRHGRSSSSFTIVVTLVALTGVILLTIIYQTRHQNPAIIFQGRFTNHHHHQNHHRNNSPERPVVFDGRADDAHTSEREDDEIVVEEYARPAPRSVRPETNSASDYDSSFYAERLEL